MIKKRTTLILGAGASVPYGFPTGQGLLQDIIKMLDIKTWSSRGEQVPLSILHDHHHRMGLRNEDCHLFDFCNTVRQLRPTNIDYFLRENPKFSDIGKRVISYLIKKREHNHHGDIVPSYAENSSYPWYSHLFDQVFRSSKKESFDDKPFSIITFNYDVSLDYYLAKALVTNQSTSASAQAIFNNIPIIHLYGQVGKITVDKQHVNYKYGACQRNLNRENGDLLEEETWDLVKDCELYVVGEDKCREDAVTKQALEAQKILKDSARIIIIGFACDQNNCDLLRFGGWENKEVYITNMTKSPAQSKRTLGWIGRTDLFSERNCDAYTLLTEQVDLSE